VLQMTVQALIRTSVQARGYLYVATLPATFRPFALCKNPVHHSQRRVGSVTFPARQ
jgi:hypothetical protein